MILADGSVWVDHLRIPDSRMIALLLRESIIMHPFVVAEIALGSLRNRRRTLQPLENLRQIEVARIDEVRNMIERHSLYSRGIGLVDAHLIASCLISPGTQLWTRDTRLESVAESLGVVAELPLLN